ncbi:Aste57867_21511 [Aphanomyces stellatus]|uniref:Aste57867_21511 protein n=1 Tax=Aphanomyces stellatus TaxID=120398 RepID=A0A485LIE4_9STRA|nr:hypothetical protein As57867_021442 [Aphanomyces stellatus]VFT98181.1 Aste57867_21511 [Aphanomyces stellatus]
MAHNNAGKYMVAGFVSLTAATIGFLHIYVPNYTELGRDVHERAAANQGRNGGASPVAGSMWKNLNRQVKSNQDSAAAAAASTDK